MVRRDARPVVARSFNLGANVLGGPFHKGRQKVPVVGRELRSHRDPDGILASRRHGGVSISQPVQCGSYVGHGFCIEPPNRMFAVI